ncbi:hypothetical protein D515_04291 [Grimontia indica]|uniref:Uncharacterized protein n=1 Tax=Grimontia indica TaxID=1056512 RepID=R1GZ64_9GAMM|nr:hypothetical protein D515_04291 [Grimontia indica]
MRIVESFFVYGDEARIHDVSELCLTKLDVEYNNAALKRRWK